MSNLFWSGLKESDMVIMSLLPVVMRFNAAGTPMSLGRRWVPPAAGSRPSVTSGSPNLA